MFPTLLSEESKQRTREESVLRLIPLQASSILLCCFILSTPTWGDALPRTLNQLLEKTCVSCHGPDSQEGGFRIDTLDKDIANGPDADRWHEALNRINSGEMPPKEATGLNDKEFEDLTDWMTRELKSAARSRRQTDGKVVFRRLNRDEYNNTLNDIFGIELDVAQLLPPERSSEDGFTNNGEELVMSPLHFESFLKIARLYFDRALVDESEQQPDRSGFAIEMSRDKNGRPRGLGHSLSHDHTAINLPLGTYPNIDPKKNRRGNFNGEILESSVILPPARRATGTQIPARRGPQPRLEIPLKSFPDSGKVKVRVRARTVPAVIQKSSGVQVEIFDLLPDCDLRSFDGKQPTRTVFSDSFDLRDLGISIEKVSLRFTTLLRVPTTGVYHFFSSADDGASLYVDGNQLLDAEKLNQEVTGSLHLEKGLHPITVTYHDTGGGERLIVQWQGPEFERQDIPAEALVNQAEQIRGDAPIEVQVHPLLPDTELASYQDLKPLETLYSSDLDIHQIGIEIEKISLRFRTRLQVPVTGTYTFHTHADDGSTVYINKKEVANKKGLRKPIELDAGKHELIVTYFDTGGGDSMSVEWEGPNIPRGKISTELFERPELEVTPEPRKERAKPVAYLSVMVANRLDDGVEFEPISDSVAVRATGEPETYEFVGRMENLPLPFRSRTGVSGDLTDARLFLLNRWEPAYASGPHLEIFSVEFEAPVYDQWPPKSHTAIMNSDDPSQLIRHFLNRAFRRPPRQGEIARLLKLWNLYAEDHPESSLSEIAAEVLPAALISPSFLYLVEPDGIDSSMSDRQTRRPLNDHELANRLSYFLTRTMPDAELRELADVGKLSNPVTLRKQARRLLLGRQSDAFVAGFIDQWLDLNALERIPVDRKKHATYQPWLRDSMRTETREWFAKVMREQRHVLELIDSDILYINPILAEHYGIYGVTGTEFREVPVPRDSHRGGLLTQAAFLTGNSNGVDSHPIKRGVWLLDRILNDPPPPPPPNVPELDTKAPELKGKTLTEQLAIHRDVQACRNCHQQIDPFGLPFESFNTVGQWRNSEDTQTTLPDGITIDGIDQLKEYLVTHRKDDFAEALARKLLAWGLGRSLSFSDEEEIKEITDSFRESEYRIIPLIESIVTSESFTHH